LSHLDEEVLVALRLIHLIQKKMALVVWVPQVAVVCLGEKVYHHLMVVFVRDVEVCHRQVYLQDVEVYHHQVYLRDVEACHHQVYLRDVEVCHRQALSHLDVEASGFLHLIHLIQKRMALVVWVHQVAEVCLDEEALSHLGVEVLGALRLIRLIQKMTVLVV